MIMKSCKFGPAKSAHLRRQQWQNTRKTHLVGMRKYEEVTSQEIREKRIPAFEISTNVIKIEQTHSFTTYTYIDTFIWCCILRFAISSIRGVRHVVKKISRESNVHDVNFVLAIGFDFAYINSSHSTSSVSNQLLWCTLLPFYCSREYPS